MTKKSKAQLKAQVDANIVVNGNREITPPKHNSIETNEIDSFLNIVDGGVVVDALTGYSADLTPTDDKHWTPKKYVDDQIAASTPTGVLLAANNLDDLGNLSTAKTNLGINNVNNTSDANKPVSTAQAVADALVLSTAQTYADSLVVGLWDDRGNYNASVNTFPASSGSGSAGAVKKGDIWTVSVAGTLGGHAVTAGDTVRALIDTPGQTDSNWAIAENNIGYVPEPAITAGTTAQYWKGDKTWATLATDVLAIVLTGLSLSTGTAITAADTILSALGKLQKQITDNVASIAANTTSISTLSSSVNSAYVALTDAASMTIDFNSKRNPAFTWTSSRTAVTFAISNDLFSSEAYIQFLKTTASNLVLTFPAGTIITDQNGAIVTGVAVTLTSTSSGDFDIVIKKRSTGYRVVIKPVTA